MLTNQPYLFAKVNEIDGIADLDVYEHSVRLTDEELAYLKQSDEAFAVDLMRPRPYA